MTAPAYCQAPNEECNADTHKAVLAWGNPVEWICLDAFDYRLKTIAKLQRGAMLAMERWVAEP